MGLHGNLYLIKEAKEGIDRFLNDDLEQIMAIKRDLERTDVEIRKEILNSEKRETPAAVEGEAEVSRADQNVSDQISNLS